ncbi:hypothetical protein EGW08_000725 [Elysia chlorotica]|uniref:Uncharacterized protein n=1 Tax=Elysia chlorotica TaxID=188477 RepID=A0A3S1A0T0_ELYCH|nr:hypothetical protein EGW08_000725 [Elysia chlorotica]
MEDNGTDMAAVDQVRGVPVILWKLPAHLGSMSPGSDANVSPVVLMAGGRGAASDQGWRRSVLPCLAVPSPAPTLSQRQSQGDAGVEVAWRSMDAMPGLYHSIRDTEVFTRKVTGGENHQCPCVAAGKSELSLSISRMRGDPQQFGYWTDVCLCVSVYVRLYVYLCGFTPAPIAVLFELFNPEDLHLLHCASDLRCLGLATPAMVDRSEAQRQPANAALQKTNNPSLCGHEL